MDLFQQFAVKVRVPGAKRILSKATRVERKMFLLFSRKFEISSILTKFKELSFFHVNCHENHHTFPFFFDFLRKSLNSFRFREHNRKNKYFKFLQHQSKFFKADIRIGSFLSHNFLNAKKMVLRRCETEFCDNFRESAKTTILVSTLFAIVQRIKKGKRKFRLLSCVVVY
jgi:hypothetical protein